MDEPVRLALFGAGGIGARHLGLAGEEPECEIVAVVIIARDQRCIMRSGGWQRSERCMRNAWRRRCRKGGTDSSSR